MDYETIDFDGVYRFTNATNEDFIGLWNNKEYPFKAGTTTVMVLADETPLNVQEIRKRWAYQLATREFYKGKVYKEMVKIGKFTPSTFNENLLEPWIEECLKPLPIAKSMVKTRKTDSERNYKSKAVDKKGDLNYEFKDQEVKELGTMSDTPIN